MGSAMPSISSGPSLNACSNLSMASVSTAALERFGSTISHSLPSTANSESCARKRLRISRSIARSKRRMCSSGSRYKAASGWA